MLPLSACSMSLSLGLRLLFSSAAADIHWPDWQYPHCGTFLLTPAACTCRPTWSAPKPSIVVTRLFATDVTGVVHERTACPSMCTVHAPQTAIPQPYFVPVSPNSSRTTHIN